MWIRARWGTAPDATGPLGARVRWWRKGGEGKGHTDGELEGVAGGGVDEGGGSGDPDGHCGAVAAAIRGRGRGGVGSSWWEYGKVPIPPWLRTVRT